MVVVVAVVVVVAKFVDRHVKVSRNDIEWRIQQSASSASPRSLHILAIETLSCCRMSAKTVFEEGEMH